MLTRLSSFLVEHPPLPALISSQAASHLSLSVWVMEFQEVSFPCFSLLGFSLSSLGCIPHIHDFIVYTLVVTLCILRVALFSRFVHHPYPRKTSWIAMFLIHFLATQEIAWLVRLAVMETLGVILYSPPFLILHVSQKKLLYVFTTGFKYFLTCQFLLWPYFAKFPSLPSRSLLSYPNLYSNDVSKMLRKILKVRNPMVAEHSGWVFKC